MSWAYANVMRRTPLRRSTPLKRTGNIARRKKMRPESEEHAIARKAFREKVFAAHGKLCHFCGSEGNMDPMHVLPRSALNRFQRYAFAAENGRPGCRHCHTLQESGEYAFADDVIDGALNALRTLGTVKDPRTGVVLSRLNGTIS